MPTVTSISPTYVANPGTDSIGVYGSGFTDATRVLIGDHDAASFTVQSDTEIWATTHNEYTPSSRVAVYVEGPDGRSDNPGEAAWLTLGDAPPDPTGPAGTRPVVESISPTYVANPGTDSIGIYGSGFTGATKVFLGEDEPALAFSVQSDTEIWATTHNLLTPSSRVRVYVEGPGGKSEAPGEAAWLTLGEVRN